jgi:hypothetical protein
VVWSWAPGRIFLRSGISGASILNTTEATRALLFGGEAFNSILFVSLVWVLFVYLFLSTPILLSYSPVYIGRIPRYSTGISSRSVLCPFVVFPHVQRWLYTTDIVYTLYSQHSTCYSIWLFNPEIVIATIRALLQKPVPIGIPEIKTPITCYTVHRVQKAYNIEPCKQNLELIFCATSQLAVQSSIQQHENLDLRRALIIEQKKRQCGQRLNLIGEEDSGLLLFTPSHIGLARAYLESKDDVEQARKGKIAE